MIMIFSKKTFLKRDWEEEDEDFEESTGVSHVEEEEVPNNNESDEGKPVIV